MTPDFDDTTTPADAHCYRALTARDARFDGIFFTGVSSTGIYCRPVCPARTPRAEMCRFFSSAAAAEQAGFRPCLRCRPELAPYALQQNLAYAVWQRIAAGALNHHDEGSGIEALAATVGLSSRQLRRVLLQHFGVTPVGLAQTQRLLFAKKLLQETTLPMTALAHAAGFGSVRRFNALFAARYGIAPGAIRRSAGEHRDGDALVLRLAYRPPLAWTTMLTYLAGRSMPGLETVDAGAYLRSVQLDGASGWLRVTHLPLKNQLQLEIAPALADVLMPLLARVRSQFDLDANPTLIDRHLAQDPLLAAQITRLPGLRVPGCFDVFELAVRAVLGQQISVAGATTLSGRLVARFGALAATPFASIQRHFPSADLLAATPVEAIAGLGMPRSRAATIRAVAQFAVQGGLAIPPGQALAPTISALRSVHGIGEWTAQYIALRALRFPDAFPAGDLGLQKAAAPQRLTEAQLLVRAGDWAPWRAYAALRLWQSLRDDADS
ncbi:AlkA N-terminal domain-containing protein [Actimicrobium sp. CCC2.4]|uniref:AlkA N-terminal domain-containing protein n=1 Tax=Actimicrobium sp. CCC2.4 TaxID=3048606 RepID=UPI002AC9BFFA|nr:AlkA N-terminal domain-containing protein [Actimicrobium sp. CCC2.4]MEB0135991.1 AlkA N-terminal domain-containing protein [Actimicrobium sp. CCC2.4]WPX32654.1 AlkA N-terminal domain-containing protein [Actimicrobium sp. CCC2.4]